MKANSKNQLLVHHLISVGELAKLSISKINFDENIINKEDMAKMSFLAGLFHDIGKIDPSFQLFINKKNEFDEDFEQSFDGYHQDTDILESRATHNELSWAILTSFNITINGKSINKPTFIQYAVYWHHKKLIRKDDGKFDNNISILKSLGKDYPKFLINLEDIVLKINTEFKSQFNEDLNLEISPIDMEDISVTPIPKFKDYDINTKEYNESKNARQTFLRSILIFADRSISSMGINDLDIIFKNKRLNLLINRGFEELLNEDNYISKAIEHGLKSNNFNNEERNLKQTEIADEMVNKPFVVLGGPPGCGKTKIALQKIQKENPKKIFWVCPRINVCQAVFEELYREYTPDLTVEIFTGEFKQTKTGTSKLVDTDPDKYLSGDIVVITIDQILSILVKNGKAHNFIKVLDSHFVFDEFHEIFSIPGMVFIFKEMLFLFKNLNIPCLLMSATPNPSFLKKICSFFNEDIHLKKAWDFHDKDFLLDFNSLNKDDNSIRLLNEMDTIHIYNSIDKAQSDYLKITETNETLLFHSSFNKEDKQIIYKELMSNFGKKRNINSRDFNIVRAGPVIQASLNISAQNLITDVCSPENLIQRIGRCNRFGESNIGNIQILNYVNKNEGPIVYLQRVEFSKNSSLEFYKYLELQNKCNKRSDLMSMYYDFHKKFSQFYDLDWLDIEKEAFKFLKNFEERKYISKNTSNKNKIVAGFRGESLHILPIIVKQLSPLIFDTYIYDITKPIDLKKTLTLSSSDIDLDQLVRDYSGICTNSNFQKKYGMKNNKWNTKEESLKFKAKDPSTPIFVSYDDKDHKNDPAATNKNHNLVYVPFIKGMKSLGLISIEKIK